MFHDLFERTRRVLPVRVVTVWSVVGIRGVQVPGLPKEVRHALGEEEGCLALPSASQDNARLGDGELNAQDVRA